MKAISKINFEVPYSSGNLRKYKSANPLKRLLVRLMQDMVADLAAEACGGADGVWILDAGCGEGLNAALLENRLPRANLVLLDASEGALEYARTLCSERCSFVCGSVLALPFPDGAFDFVLCTEVLEHLEQPETALAELLRVSSGRVLVSVPHEPWFCLGNLLTLRNVGRLGNPPDHVNRWTSAGFRRWIGRNADGRNAVLYHAFPWLICLIRRERE